MQENMRVQYKEESVLDRIEYHYIITAKVKEMFWHTHSEMGIYAADSMRKYAGGRYTFHPKVYGEIIFYEGQDCDWNWDKEWLEDIVEDRDYPIALKIYKTVRTYADEEEDE